MQESKETPFLKSDNSAKQRIIQLASLAILLSVAGVAWGKGKDNQNNNHCGWGEVEATFQALPVGYVHTTDFGAENRRAGLGGGTEHCQFRVFDDGQTYTFNAGDLVVGGLVQLFDYRNWGFTRAEAIDDLEAVEDRVWFGPSGGELVEQELERTAYKQMHRPDWGLTLYQQRAFVTQLAPGEYDSYWEENYYGAPWASAMVHIVVLPSP